MIQIILHEMTVCLPAVIPARAQPQLGCDTCKGTATPGIFLSEVLTKSGPQFTLLLISPIPERKYSKSRLPDAIVSMVATTQPHRKNVDND